MPKTHRNTASTAQDSNTNGFDRNTPSKWHLDSLEQLRTITVAVLQKELRSRNFSHKRNKSALSSCLYESLHPTTSNEKFSIEQPRQHDHGFISDNHSNPMTFRPNHMSDWCQQQDNLPTDITITVTAPTAADQSTDLGNFR